MHAKLQRMVGTFLLATNLIQVAAAAVLPAGNTPQQLRQQQTQTAASQSNPELQNLTLTTNQLGVTGPLSAGMNYSNLTGAYLSGQFLKLIDDKLGFNLLGEYGDKQYRLNGTIGFLIGAQSFFKITAEQLGQQLPFYFMTGSIEQRVKQNALGARFQQQLNSSFLDNLSIGAYGARTPNVRLAPVGFISNGSNCQGFAAGLLCVNERNIAGGESSGADMGLGSYLTRSTYIEGKLYYDTLKYNTIFTPDSIYDRSGFGGGISAQQLIASNLKFSASAEIRQIYNTYNVALSWMPPKGAGTELSVFGQRVVSRNQLPNDDTIGLKVTLFADRANYQAPVYALSNAPVVNSVASWISQPAVKMNQVLAISEEMVHLAAALISAINPNFGPLAGGNTVTITGSNFLSGALVQFGGNIATITSITPTTLTVIVPPGNQLGGVPVTVTTPDGQTTTLNNGYLYSNGFAPILNSINPFVGPVAGGTSVTISGANFVVGSTSVTIGGITIPANQVTVNSPVSLSFITPAHPAGTVLVTVTTPAGTSNPLPGGFTYAATPTTTSLIPNAGPTSGGTTVTITGTNFASGDTSVTIDGVVIPASSVNVISSTALSFSTPAHAIGNVDISVTTSGGTSNLVPGGFTYTNSAATVSAVSPSSGPAAGGTSVTITGTNFVSGNTVVTIGGIVIPAGSVTFNSSTSVSFTTPAHIAGTVDVSVTTPSGTSGFVPGGFTYLNAPTALSLTPTAGPSAGGTSVTIAGTDFVAGDTIVNIGGNLVSAAVNSSTSLTIITPPHAAGTVIVTVITSGGASVGVPGGFTYQDAPTATALTPTSGPSAGGTLVTVTGTGFVMGETTVTIGGIALPSSSVNVISTTSLTFTTPSHAAGSVSVIVSTAGGDSGVVPGGFTYLDGPTAVALNPVSGPSAGGTVVTVTGTGFAAGETTVTIGGTLIPANLVNVNSATSLTFSTPAHAAGNVDVNVSTAGGISNNILGGFTYMDAPVALSLVPPSGPVAGGTVVTVSGIGFISGDTSVTIGGIFIPASSVIVNLANSLIFVTPPHLVGNVAVNVSTPGGVSNDIPGGYTYEEIPTTTTLLPNAGPITGNTLVTITGTGFVMGATTVTIGGITIPSGSVNVSSPTSLTFLTPAHAAGLVDVSVSTAGGTSNNVPGGFTYNDTAATVSSLSPLFGPTNGGTLVTITGTNFEVGDTSVTIGGIVIPATSVTVITPLSLTFTTPSHAAGNVDVSVTTSVGSSGLVPGGFTYEAVPTTTSLSPTAGPIAGGTSVTVFGTGFVAGDTSVTIDGIVIAAGLVTVNSPTSLTFSTPPHLAGNVDVSVTTSVGGTSNTVPGGFTYTTTPATVSAVSPSSGPAAGGTSVTITGTNFVSGNTVVTIGGIVIPAGSVTFNSSTSVSFTTPAHIAGTVDVSVTTPSGTSGFVPGGFTYLNAPTALSLTPTAGPSAGGTSVTITGTDFVNGDTSVTIGGNVVTGGSVTVNSPTSLTFITPAHAAGLVAVTVTTSGGISSPVPGGFIYEDVPTATSLTPTAGPVAGGTVVTITGTGFVTNDTTVTIGGILIPAVSVTVNSATSLTFTTPAHAAGNVAVSVTTSGGSGNVPGGFTYVATPTATSLTPTSGPTVGGTSVTITGTGFVANNTSVTIGGNTVSGGSVTVNSATSLTFTTPAHAAGAVTVFVTTPGGISTNVPGGFTYVAAPTALSLTPTSGTTAGGTTVTVSGTGFVMGNTTVTIGGTTIAAGSVTVNSATSLSFSTPSHAAGNVAVTVTTAGGTSGNVPGGYTYLAPSLVSCSAPIPSLLGIQLLTCIGANLTLFDVTFLTASGSAACSTFPTQQVLPTINIFGNVLITATNVPATLGLIGCDIQLCSNNSCSVLGGVAGPVGVTLGL